MQKKKFFSQFLQFKHKNELYVKLCSQKHQANFKHIMFLCYKSILFIDLKKEIIRKLKNK